MTRRSISIVTPATNQDSLNWLDLFMQVLTILVGLVSVVATLKELGNVGYFCTVFGAITRTVCTVLQDCVRF